MTRRQDDAFEKLTNAEDCSILYGGAKGGGKSYLLCLWAYCWAKHLINLFNITEVQKYPIPVGFLGRKRGVDFTKTTLETWKDIIPSNNYELKDQDKEIIISKKVKLFYGGLDDEEVVNKFNSAELAFIAIDQAEETSRPDLSVLQASLRRTHNGIIPPYKRLYTANPAECWLKEDFITNPRLKFYYIPALPSDNPYLPGNYLQTLDESFAYDPVLLAAYKEGNWDLLQGHQNLITQNALTMLKDVVNDWLISQKVVACDPAIGGDECVLYFMENYAIKDTLILHLNDTQQIGAEVVKFMDKHHVKDFAVDAIGIGKGVADYVRAEIGKNVIDIISSAKPMDSVHFVNVRSEMWNFTARKIHAREIPYPTDEKLRRQLCAVKYKTSAKKFELVPKEITKNELGSSPDRADAFVIGIYATDRLDKAVRAGKSEFANHNYNPFAAMQKQSQLETTKHDYNPLMR